MSKGRKRETEIQKDRNTQKMSKAEEKSFIKDFKVAFLAAGGFKAAAIPFEGIRLFLNPSLTNPWHIMLANLVRFAPYEALAFSFKDLFRRSLSLQEGEGSSRTFWVLGNLLSGGAAGGATSLIISPFNYCEIRYLNDFYASRSTGQRKYKGRMDAFRKILIQEGLSGIFKELPLTLSTSVLYRGIYLGGYDSARPFVLGGGEESGFLEKFALGYFITGLALLAALPIWSVRQRLKMVLGIRVCGIVSPGWWLKRDGAPFLGGSEGGCFGGLSLLPFWLLMIISLDAWLLAGGRVLSSFFLSFFLSFFFLLKSS